MISLLFLLLLCDDLEEKNVCHRHRKKGNGRKLGFFAVAVADVSIAQLGLVFFSPADAEFGGKSWKTISAVNKRPDRPNPRPARTGFH